MKLRYFVVDEANELCSASAKTLEGIWSGRWPAEKLGLLIRDELRVVTIVCDDDLNPKVCYFLRLDLQKGAVTDDSRIRALEAVEESNKSNLDHPAVVHQLARWPRDWRCQVAVALDVPAAAVNNIGIGGLFPLADLLGISVHRLLGFFEQAFQP
jgi:hypothetical protein